MKAKLLKQLKRRARKNVKIKQINGVYIVVDRFFKRADATKSNRIVEEIYSECVDRIFRRLAEVEHRKWHNPSFPR